MRSSIRRPVTNRFLLGLVIFAIAGVVLALEAPRAQRTGAVADAGVMPQYDADGHLRLPGGYRQWVLVGSSLGLSYAEGVQGRQTFNATLMEPGAYRHFVQTGEFREGTMLALIVQGVGTDAAPARQGQYATGVHGVEMAVKDTARVPEGWAYYGFGGPMSGGYRTTAAPQPKSRCFDCHDEHAGLDKVFTQFYGLLNDAREDQTSTVAGPR
jgi:hypothetical protein